VRFRAVLFDAGETLVHPSPSFPALAARALAEAGHARSPEEVVEASKAVFEHFSRAAREQNLWTTSPEKSARFWKDVYADMLEALGLPGQDGLRDTLYGVFTDLGNYALFDDVRPALDALAPSGATLGIVSNFEAWLEDLLGRLDVRDLFPVRVISGRVGMEKPDPRIYLLALSRAGVEATEAAYVGDNPEFDVVPTAALGMTPVLIDRRDRFPGFEGLRITDMRQLATALGSAP